MTQEDNPPAPAFNDPRNITVGKARVIWARACGRHPEGYVLPGGAFFAIRDGLIARVTNYYNLEDWLAQVR